jgi:hypothetical protein
MALESVPGQCDDSFATGALVPFVARERDIRTCVVRDKNGDGSCRFGLVNVCGACTHGSKSYDQVLAYGHQQPRISAQ